MIANIEEMILAHHIAELAAKEERAAYLRIKIKDMTPIPVDPPYGCQEYDAARLCRFDRRAISRKCDGCNRVTDRAYLEAMGLWIEGVSHG